MADKEEQPSEPKIYSCRITVGADGTVQYEGDKEAIAEAVEDYVNAKARKVRRDKKWGPTGIGAGEPMTRLAQLFPCLREAPGVDPWDPIVFLRWGAMGVRSHGEELAASFVLGVWSPHEDWDKACRQHKVRRDPKNPFKRFDLFEAMNIFDQESINALLAWIELPFFP